MRRLSAALTGLALALTLSAPAWADTVQERHHRSNSPANDRSRGDGTQHDDPSILF